MIVLCDAAVVRHGTMCDDQTLHSELSNKTTSCRRNSLWYNMALFPQRSVFPLILKDGDAM